MVCSGSFEWWTGKQGSRTVALGQAHDALVLVYEIVSPCLCQSRRPQCVWKIHWYLPPSQLPVLASILHKLFIWNRKKPSLTWLVRIKVWLVSQTGIKICRETCCTRAAQSFLGQCRFCISGSLVFEALLMNAEITWLPYFLIFELELSTFLGMLWLRIQLAFEDKPLGSP